MIVFDTVYNPENTLFLKQGRRALLPHDFRDRNVRAAGRAAVRILHGPAAPIDVMVDTAAASPTSSPVKDEAEG